MMAFLVQGLKNLVSGSSNPGKAHPPEGCIQDGCIQLNDSIWELHSPNGIPQAEIIFFHGLQIGPFQDAFWKTWVTANDEEIVWPQKWLSKKLPTTRILSVTYNSSALNRDGQPDMYCLGENLVNDIIQDQKANICQNCPVFLVGHSLGGIVLKQFVLHALKKLNLPEKGGNYQGNIDRINFFLQNLKGVFYYATPHGGSEIANKVKDLAGLIDASPILSILETLDSRRAKINSDFQRIQRNYNLQAFAVGEGRETFHKVFKGWVVTEASARQGVDDYHTYNEADHFSVCKARDVNDAIVIERLATLVRNCVRGISYTENVTDGTDQSGC